MPVSAPERASGGPAGRRGSPVEPAAVPGMVASAVADGAASFDEVVARLADDPRSSARSA